jgi:hypothetical protein
VANGISRHRLYEHLCNATSRDGILDLWVLAKDLADDTESYGEDDFFSPSDVPRRFLCTEEPTKRDRR